MKTVLKFFFYTIGAILTALGIWHLVSIQKISLSQDIPSTFEGDFLAISDADMIATGYATGICNKVEGIEDSLINIEFVNNKPTIKSKIHTTNSVAGWPAILEWHPQKQYAYVAETRGKIKPGDNFDNVYTGLPKGGIISIVNYSDSAAPKVLQTTKVGENIQNVSINSKGDLLAVGNTQIGKELALITLKDGMIDKVLYFSDEAIAPSEKGNGGVRTAEFHPTKDVIAVNLNDKQVVFFKINRKEKISIERIGSPLEVGKKLSVGNWHPSGNYFLISDLGWGKGQLGFALNKKGHLTSIQFDENGNHSIASKVKVGLSPEGFDISPNGNYAITVNMNRTYLPQKFGFIPGRKNSSLSLVKINSETGKLSILGGEYGFIGTLPEDAIFDKDGNSIAVAIFHEKTEGFPTSGWIDFWEIQNDQLIKTSSQLRITRGAHNLLLIP